MMKPAAENNVGTPEKCCDLPTHVVFKTLNGFPLSDNQARRNLNSSKSKEETNSGCARLQYRYIIALFGFFMYGHLNFLRIGTSMSVVKMVNNTAVNFKKNLNGTIYSCPLNDSFVEEFTEPNEEGEFNWSPQIQGYILSAGFLGYMVSLIPGGMLAEAYGAKEMLFSGTVISSLAHLLCPFAAWYNHYLMIALQFLRGVGQGFMPPSSSSMAAKWFPKPERGFLNSCMFLGYSVGSLTAYAISGSLCSSTVFGGWPLVYYVFGGLGLLFSLCIHLFLYESPKEHPTIGNAELIYILENLESDLSEKQPPTPWIKILTSVPVYALTFSLFADYWALSQQQAEHPIFLARILHFPIQTNGLINSIPFAFEIVVVFIGSWVSKWLNTNGYVGVDKVRKGFTMLYSLGYSGCLLGTYFAGCNRVWSNICSSIGFILSAFSVPGCLIVPSDMSPTFAGSLCAFTNTVANLATIVLPLMVGAMIDVEESLEQWRKIFLICIGVVMSSGILFCIFGSAEVQPWNFPPSEGPDRNRTKVEDEKQETNDNKLSVEMSTHF